MPYILFSLFLFEDNVRLTNIGPKFFLNFKFYFCFILFLFLFARLNLELGLE